MSELSGIVGQASAPSAPGHIQGLQGSAELVLSELSTLNQRVLDLRNRLLGPSDAIDNAKEADVPQQVFHEVAQVDRVHSQSLNVLGEIRNHLSELETL